MTEPVRIGYLRFGAYFARPEVVGLYSLWITPRGWPDGQDLLLMTARKQAKALFDTEPQGSA